MIRFEEARRLGGWEDGILDTQCLLATRFFIGDPLTDLEEGSKWWFGG